MTSFYDQSDLRVALKKVRRELTKSLSENDSLAEDEALTQLLLLGMPLKIKCESISIKTILSKNCLKKSDWETLSLALGILDKYAANLLKPEADRPGGWEAVKTNNRVFLERIDPIVGARHILTDIGYSERGDEEIRMKDQPNDHKILCIRADLKIAKAELDMYKNASHPNPQQLDVLVNAEARILQDPSKQESVRQRKFAETITNPPASPSDSLSSLSTNISSSPITQTSPSESEKSTIQSKTVSQSITETDKNTDKKSNLPGKNEPAPSVPSTDGKVACVSQDARVNPPQEPSKPNHTASHPRPSSSGHHQTSQIRHQIPQSVRKQAPQMAPKPIRSEAPLLYPDLSHDLHQYPAYPAQWNPQYQVWIPQMPYPGGYPTNQPQKHHIASMYPGAPYHPREPPPSYHNCMEYADTPNGPYSWQLGDQMQNQPQQAWPPNDQSQPFVTPSASPIEQSTLPLAERQLSPPASAYSPHSSRGSTQRSAPYVIPNSSRGSTPQRSPPDVISKSTDIRASPTKHVRNHVSQFEKDGFTGAQARPAVWKAVDGANADNTGWLGKLKRLLWWDSTASNDEHPVAYKHSKAVVWPGTVIPIPQRYQEELLKERDEVQRFVMLKSLIEMLDIELQNFDEGIEKIILSHENYHKDPNYKKFSRRRDDLKRELLLVKRVRDEVKHFIMVDEELPIEKPKTPVAEHSTPNKHQGLSAKEAGDVREIKKKPIIEEAKKKPSIMWACEFCTSHNEMNMNVCTVCYQASKNKRPIEVPVEDEEQETVPPKDERKEEKMEADDVTNMAGGDATNAVKNDELGEAAHNEQWTKMNKLLESMQEAEKLGYTVHQFDFSLRACAKTRLSPIDWLKNNWSMVVKYVEEELEDNDESGKFTRAEVEEALGKSTGTQDAVNVCIQTRRNLMNSLCDCYLKCISRDVIFEAVVQNSGNEQEICGQLNKLVLTPLTEELEEESKKAKPGLNTMMRNVGTGLADVKEMICNNGNDRLNRTTALMFECQLTQPVAETVLLTMELLDPEVLNGLHLNEIIDAVTCNNSIDKTLDYLQRECPLCFDIVPEIRTQTLFFCQCKFCKDCLVDYFTVQINENPANAFSCPVCQEPDLNLNTEAKHHHFQMLENLLNELLVDRDLYELFQNKVLNWNLFQDPRFRWCITNGCVQGFLHEPNVLNQLRMTCPACRLQMCFECDKRWEPQHDGLTCQQFADWKEKSNPELSNAGIDKLLEENGIMCPNCKTRYLLARGGCLHFTCSFCKFEFCSGCNQKISKDCVLYNACRLKGLHAHHPRDCLYHLRDYDCDQLTELLNDNGVQSRSVTEQADIGPCHLMEQKQGANGFYDEACGKDLHYETGLCEMHYREYLVTLVNRNNIDPVEIMDVGALEGHLHQHDVHPPNYGQQVEQAQQAQPQHLKQLRLFVKETIPLQE